MKAPFESVPFSINAGLNAQAIDFYQNSIKALRSVISTRDKDAAKIKPPKPIIWQSWHLIADMNYYVDKFLSFTNSVSAKGR